MSRRGIIYITWGDKTNQVHQRSIDSASCRSTWFGSRKMRPCWKRAECST